MKTLKTFVATAAVSLLTLSTTGAHAGGWIADTFIKPLSPELARAADQINHNLGNPVDHAIAAGLDVMAPGVGSGLEAGWAIQRSGVLDGLPPLSAPMSAPVMRPPVMQPMPQHLVGNFCHTPAGRFGPGPVNNLGAGCFVNLPFGPVYGTVGM